MELTILENADAVAKYGADRICELVNKKPAAVIGLATGSTPIAMYQQLIEFHRRHRVSFLNVTTFNLDEYIGISAENPQSCRSFMNRELFDAIDIDTANTHLPACGRDDNPRQVGIAYEQAIINAGGIDLQILGIGGNGHIGFNEPTSSLSSRTRVKTLTQTTMKDNSRFFDKDESQPHLAVTMGIATILDSRRVLLLATGEQKAEAVRDAVEGPVSAMSPASALQFHERATIVLDNAAAARLEHKRYYRLASRENKPLVEKYGNFYEI